ncbi:carboxymuconolactone decarboxylase family protein [Demequina rhizosphaerae]|uniref:carboxymuconolactone decarboxylase family protein n=1 Tax=Demequina rhizosphaerae TaxID=1638985 RepID=UPI0007848213|nr:carboxymuconolactone decarboxylase family protein [Demequina rhizosphaerae]
MSRLSKARGGPGTRVLLFFTRRGLAAAAGTNPERATEPLEVYAHAPRLLRAYGRLEQASSRRGSMDTRYMALATLKASTLVACPYCIDLGSQISRTLGLRDAEMLALPRYETSELFDATDRLVLDYAVGMTRTPAVVSDALFTALRARFSERQIVELTHQIALENMRGRYGVALDLGAAGFSEGMVCALPEPRE